MGPRANYNTEGMRRENQESKPGAKTKKTGVLRPQKLSGKSKKGLAQDAKTLQTSFEERDG